MAKLFSVLLISVALSACSLDDLSDDSSSPNQPPPPDMLPPPDITPPPPDITTPFHQYDRTLFLAKQNYPPSLGGSQIKIKLSDLDSDSGSDLDAQDMPQFNRSIYDLLPLRMREVTSASLSSYEVVADYSGEFIIPKGAINFNLFVIGSQHASKSRFSSVTDPNGQERAKSRRVSQGINVFAPTVVVDTDKGKERKDVEDVIVPGVWNFTFSQQVHKHSMTPVKVILTIKNYNAPSDRLLIRPLSYENSDMRQVDNVFQSAKQLFNMFNISNEILPVRSIGVQSPLSIRLGASEDIAQMYRSQFSYKDIGPEQLSVALLGEGASLPGFILGISPAPGAHLTAALFPEATGNMAIVRKYSNANSISPRQRVAATVVHESLHYAGLEHTTRIRTASRNKTRTDEEICAEYDGFVSRINSPGNKYVRCAIDADGIKATNHGSLIGGDANIMDAGSGAGAPCTFINNFVAGASYGINMKNFEILCEGARRGSRYYHLAAIQKEIVKNSMIYHSLPIVNNNSISPNRYYGDKYKEDDISVVDDGRYYRSDSTVPTTSIVDCILRENTSDYCLLPLPANITQNFVNPRFTLSSKDRVLLPQANILPNSDELITNQSYLNVKLRPNNDRHGVTILTLTITNNSQFYASANYTLLVEGTKNSVNFPQSSYEFNISYSSSEDSFVGVVQVNYLSEEQLNYTLSNDYGIFSIDDKGNITLMRQISAADIGSYKINVTVGGISFGEMITDKVGLTINIINLAPQWEQEHYGKIIYIPGGDSYISPGIAIGTNIIQVKAIDVEDISVSYAIVDSPRFRINSDGNISNLVDLLPNDFYSFNVMASDTRGKNATVNVIISVSDIIDNDGDGVTDPYDSDPHNPHVVVNGSGKRNDPFVISNIYQLQAIAGVDHQGTELEYSAFSGWRWLFGANRAEQLNQYYVLGNDINASTTRGWNMDDSNIASGFHPIGSDRCVDFTCVSNSIPFGGHFNGSGFAIKSLYINFPDGIDVGLFGGTDNAATIISLDMLDVDITGQGRVGGLAGYQRQSSIKASSVNGIIRGGYHTGGLVGSQDRSSIVSSYAKATVTSKSAVGGLVGRHIYGIITASHSISNVNGRYDVGGLVGSLIGGAIITASYSISNVSGISRVGGLVGEKEGSVIRLSYALGNVSSVSKYGSALKVGGLVGELMGGDYVSILSGSVISSYASAEVSATGGNISGFIGSMEGGLIIGSYANGRVHAPSPGGMVAGGLVGTSNGNNANIIDSYWDQDISGVLSSPGGHGLRSTQLNGCGLSEVVGIGVRLPSAPVDTNCDDSNGIFPATNWGNKSIEINDDLDIVHYGWIFEPATEAPFLFARDAAGTDLLPPVAQQLCQRKNLYGCN